MKKVGLTFSASILLIAMLFVATLHAQSSDQNFPTPITSNEISGVIKARDMGDGRLTTYYYEFDGSQGDIFINVTAKNFSGDIDVFAIEGLRPLTRIVLYADAGLTETGRLVYLRKPERMILRIEGRTPGDDAATFQIKFAGSFVALQPRKEVAPPTVAVTEAVDDSPVSVNTVGTIVPKPPRAKKVVAKRTTSKKPPVNDSPAEPSPEKNPAPPTEETGKSEDTTAPKPVVVVEDFPGVSEEAARVRKPVDTAAKPKNARTTRTRTTRTTTSKAKTKPKAENKPKAETATEEPAVDPLASIRLVVELKDGTTIEKPMNTVLRFGVDKGVLTVIGKDGSIVRYPVLEVAKVTMQ